MKQRSHEWFLRRDRNGFDHRSVMRIDGLPDHVFDGRPIIGICNTWSELNPCNISLRGVSDHVKRGIWEAGGVPLEFPVFSTGETNIRPTAMLYRNLMAMDVEESIRANPIDGVVLLGGCDKTTPAIVMGAASADLPTILVSAGPQLNGRFRGQLVGSGTHTWRFDEEYRSGRIDFETFSSAESASARSPGTCMTMGTASTVACIFETLGISMPDDSCIPAVDSRRLALAHMAGRRIVELVRSNVSPSSLICRANFMNAVRVCAALGGSTNAVLHLIAVAGRIGVPLSLDDWHNWGHDIPCLVDLMPSGRFLMEDFFNAGGLHVVWSRLAEKGLLDLTAQSLSGRSISDIISRTICYDDEVIRPFDRPVADRGGIAVLRGNVAPLGAVIKPSAATTSLLKHRGEALVFDSIEEYRARIDDPVLPVTAASVLVLRNCGPVGYPGMPEVGNLQIPKKLLQAGVTDMVRISDARMSGTAYGTVILHAAPEAAVGGPLALVRTGDIINIDVSLGKIDVELDEYVLEARRSSWVPPSIPHNGGYVGLYRSHVLQADRGVDFDFLVGRRGADVPRDCE